MAIKQLKEAPTSVPGTRGRSDIEHEATILSLLGSHPNIVEFHGVSRSNSGTFSVVTKLETGGSLEDVLGLNSRNGRESPNRNGWPGGVGSESKYPGHVRTTWARDLAHGLASSHTFGVVHNDVACRNALLSVNGSTGRALLCDFGLSSSLRGRGTGLEAACLFDLDDVKRWPLKQMPKEALQLPFALSPLSDSYMFGMTLYEVRNFCFLSVAAELRWWRLSYRTDGELLRMLNLVRRCTAEQRHFVCCCNGRAVALPPPPRVL